MSGESGGRENGSQIIQAKVNYYSFAFFVAWKIVFDLKKEQQKTQLHHGNNILHISL